MREREPNRKWGGRRGGVEGWTERFLKVCQWVLDEKLKENAV